ncbi:site-specific integrase [Xanthobacter sp. DSM 24535]|uniref:site-specific integrase n=1 Tax=Roseixanthobacter psychrophilus TaxID=3119917 RepID=UPI00372846B2
MELPKYVYKDTDRYGTVRYYYRPRGRSKVRLPDDPELPEFRIAIEAENDRIARIASGGQPRKMLESKAQTLRWLCEQYFASPTFRALDPRTQHVRQLVIGHCLREPVAPGSKEDFAGAPISMVTSKAIKVLRDRKVETPDAANSRVKYFRGVFAWAIEAEIEGVTMNPARDVKCLKRSSEGFHSWTTEEVEQFERTHGIGTKARLALALLLYTGQRRSDIVTFGKQHLNKDGWLRFTQFKNRNRKPVRLEIPIIPDLAHIIEASPTGDMTFLVTSYNKPFTSNGFGNWFRKQCDDAGLSECSAHGLRKASAARLAELGCTDREIMSFTGHVTSQEVDRYTRGANQKRLAGNVLRRINSEHA